jgi:hypothetical protein
VESNERRYHMVAWGVPGLLAILVGSLNAYGDAGNWCWIKESEPVIRFFCYYLPLILVIACNLVSFVLVGRSLRDDSSAEGAVVFRLRLYLLVFVVVRLPGVVDRIQNALSPDEPVFIIVLLHSLLSPLQGFANSLVYGCNRQVANEYRFCWPARAGRIRLDSSPVHRNNGSTPAHNTLAATDDDDTDPSSNNTSFSENGGGMSGSGVTDIVLQPLTRQGQAHVAKGRPGKDGAGDFEMIDLA